MKICVKCQADKPCGDFYAAHRSGRLMRYCKACHRAAGRIYYLNNKHKYRESEKRRYDPLKASIKNKAYRLKHRDALREKAKARRANRKPQIAAMARMRRATDPQYRAYSNVSRLIRSSLAGRLDRGATERLTGIKLSMLWMAILPKAVGQPPYDIDHIIPRSFFDLTDSHQAKICWNWRNLRPMNSTLNKIKQDKIPANWKEIIHEIEEDICR